MPVGCGSIPAIERDAARCQAEREECGRPVVELASLNDGVLRMGKRFFRIPLKKQTPGQASLTRNPLRVSH